MGKLYCVNCGKYRKFKNPKMLYVFLKYLKKVNQLRY